MLSPTLVLGLGGTGIRVLKTVRQRLRGKGAPIRYLAIDVEPASQPGDPDGLDDGEQVNLGGFNLDEVLLTLHKYPDIERFVGDEFSLRLKGKSSAMVRMAGRIALFKNFESLLLPRLITMYQELESMLKAAPQTEGAQTLQLTPRVFIVTSCCGGTGSGILLDMVYLVRSMLARWRPHVTCMLLLPSVFYDVLEGNYLRMEALKSNAYAALTEIDHFMTADARYEVEFPGKRTLDVSARAFDVCHLINMSDESFAKVESLDDLLRVVAERLTFDVSAANTRWKADARDIDTALSKLPPIKGRERLYSSFGMVNFELPVDKLMLFCIYRLSQYTIEKQFLRPVDNDQMRRGLEGFVVRADVDPSRMRHDMNDAVSVWVDRDQMSRFAEADFEGHKSTDYPHVCQSMEKMETQELISTATQKMQERYVAKMERIIGEIEGELIGAMRSNGIPYAMGLLESIGRSLANYKVEVEREIEALRDKEVVPAGHRMQVCRDAIDKLNAQSMAVNRQERALGIAREYIVAIRKHYQMFLEIRVRQMVVNLVKEVVDFIGESLEQLEALVKKLKMVHNELSTKLNEVCEVEEETVTILSLSRDLVGTPYMRKFFEKNKPEELHSYLSALLPAGHSPLKWLDIDIDTLVHDVFLPAATKVFPVHIFKKNVLDVLEEASADELKSLLARFEKVRPLWVYNKAVLGKMAPVFERRIIGVYDETDRRIAHLKSESLRLHSTGDTRSLKYMVEAYGLPLFALGEMNDWKFSYDRSLKEKLRPLHTSCQGRSLPSVVPQ
jgi:hypothetical protein